MSVEEDDPESDVFDFDITGMENKPLDQVIRHISEVLRFCLTNVEIIGCPSPGLLDHTLNDLGNLATNLRQQGLSEEKS